MTTAVYTPGLLRLDNHVWRAVHGHGGIRADKREGDGATPVATLPLRRVLYRADRGRAPHCAVPVEPLAPDDGWCDDPTNARYNQPVRLPFDASHEALWRTDAVYDIVGILGLERCARAAWPRLRHLPAHRHRLISAPPRAASRSPKPDLRAALAAGLTAIEVK